MSETARHYLGQQVGHYRLTRWLGKGGFADVYLGEHIHLKTQNAIKMLHVQLSEKALQDFLHEAQVIAGLDHPNIVRVLDYGSEEGIPYLVMSYAPNGSIRRVIPKETRVELEQIVPVVQQIAAALDHAHMRRLIHRDVKPENILVGQRGQILLSDFGLVIVAHSSNSQTNQKTAGTVPYTAPEQLQGQARFASDQYSLGIITYEWLCGARPFTGSFVDIASQHMLTPPPSLCQRVPGLSPLVEQVVFRALAKDPAQRYQTVTDFANALRDAYQQGANLLLFTDISTESQVPAVQTTTPLTPLTPPIGLHVLPQSVPLPEPVANQEQQTVVSPHMHTTATPQSDPATNQGQQTGTAPQMHTPATSQPDPAARLTQQAVVSPYAHAPTPPVPSSSAPVIIQPQMLPPQTPPRRSPNHASTLWRAVVLALLIILIVGGGGIWYATHSPGRGPGQGQSSATLPGTGPASSTATAQATAHGTGGTGGTSNSPNATSTRAANGTTAVPASGTGTPSTSAPPTAAPTHAPAPTPTPKPDCLRGSSSHLTFTSLLGINPSPRVVTLTNCGGSTQNWAGSSSTNGGGAWLSVSPSAGSMAANGNVNIQVQAASNGLQIGIYTGSLTFHKGSSAWTVTVTYTIVQA
ncbi:MAG: protein kinase [Chloroflexota bacterium]|nr:protein kinase [Chloroflexota bacterium]